jgi:hypothetical protein
MGVGGGLAGSIGVGVEIGGYGVYAAPTVWYEVESETLLDVRNRVNASGLAANVLVERGARRVTVSEDINGQIVMYATQKKIGLLLAHFMSSDVVPVAVGATGAFTAAHVDNGNGLRGKSLTIQKGIPQADGTIKPYTFLGCKITAVQFELGRGELLKLTLTVDGRQMIETQPLVAPTYTTGLLPFGFKGWALTSGVFGAETALGGVSKLTLTITRTMKTDRYNANGAGLKDEPVQNGRTVISGTMDTEFVDKTRLVDVFHADGAISVISQYVGAAITTANALLGLALPQCFPEGTTPGLANEDIVAPVIPFVALFDDIHPALTVTYVSTDATL